MENNIYLRSLSKSFDEKIDQLITELEGYSNEDLIWKTHGQISNSAGTLVLHLLGNLNHFIGALLGNSGYVRNRSLEFSLEFKARGEMVAELKNCRKMVMEVLNTFDPALNSSEYPAEFSGTSNDDYKSLIHIFGHLSYHTGQINFHRRLLDM